MDTRRELNHGAKKLHLVGSDPGSEKTGSKTRNKAVLRHGGGSYGETDLTPELPLSGVLKTRTGASRQFPFKRGLLSFCSKKDRVGWVPLNHGSIRQSGSPVAKKALAVRKPTDLRRKGVPRSG